MVCNSCGQVVDAAEKEAAAICPNCRAVLPAPESRESRDAAPEDGWFAVKSSRPAAAPRVVDDDPDDRTYDVIIGEDGPIGVEEARAAEAHVESSADDVPSIALTKVEPLKRHWEAHASLQTRIIVFGVYVLGLLIIGLIMVFSNETSLLTLLITGLVVSLLSAYVLGTYDSVTLIRDYRGRVSLTKTWRCCFISLGPRKIALKGHAAIASTANVEREIFDWLLWAWLLSLGLLPGILWWIFVFSKPIHRVALTNEHGQVGEVLYQGVDEAVTTDMARTVSEVCRYRWRRA
jgi:energy-converting hydrogenase Eha subunit A